MKGNMGQFSVRAMCRVLEVSPSGFYSWVRREPSVRVRANGQLAVEIKAVHVESRRTYGSPRIYRELRGRGAPCSENRVARVMRQHGVRAKQARRFKVTTDSDHGQLVAPNVLDRRFAVSSPDCVWASDVTYVWTREGWLYLAVVVDLHSRSVVGWAADARNDRALVLRALRAALERRRPTGPLLHHSDRGGPYASRDYREVLRQAGIDCSMSRKGDCWDNAPVESFFATLKRELIDGQIFNTRQETVSAIFEYIEVWYNRKRRHSSLGYLSPEQFEQTREQQAARAA